MKLKMLLVKNNTSYYFNENCILTENYNETLDSFSGHISHQTTEIPLEPFDKVQIIDEDNILTTRYMIVDSYIKTQEGMGGDINGYSYDVSLFSETKELEGLILPNLSITPLRTGTKRTIWYYISNYLNRYDEKVRNGSNQLVNKHSFANRVQTKFNNIEAPELQWNTPSLREVFTDLMIIADCIPVVRNNVIDYIDLTEITGTFTNFNYSQNSRSSDDYLSEIKMNLTNALNTTQTGVNNVVVNGGWQSITTDEYLLTEQNYTLKTQFPILNIKHLYVGFLTTTHEGSNYYPRFICEDLCETNFYTESVHNSLVYEYDEYKTKEILPRAKAVLTEDINNLRNSTFLSQYQNFCLYFNRGGKEVKNLNRLTKMINGLTNPDKATIYYLVSEAIVHNGSWKRLTTQQLNDVDTNPHYNALFYKIEYETTADAVFKISRENKNANNRVIVDNQTNSWVDPFTQSNLEYQKANRMGNEIIMYNQRVNPNETPIKIGNKNGDNIVYQTQYQIYDDHIEVNAYATKDYILKNYFTGVKQKLRTWVNATNEAFIRHELDKTYCEMHFTNGVNDEATSVCNYLLTPLTTNTVQPITRAEFTTTENQKVYISNVIPKYIKKSLLLTTIFNNNAVLENSVDTSKVNVVYAPNVSTYTAYITTDEDYGGVPLISNKFVDTQFETSLLTIRFYNNRRQYDLDNAQLAGSIQDVKDAFISYLNYPNVSSLDSNYLITSSFAQKDNKEIPAITKQFEFISNDDIYITDYYIKNEQAVRNVERPMIKISLVDNTNYKKGETTIPSTYPLRPPNIIASSSNYIYIDLTTTTNIENKALYIVDMNRNVLVGMNLNNYGSTTARYITLYLNLTKIRS